MIRTIRRCNNSKNFSDAVSDFDLASLETAWTLVDRRKTASDLTDWMNRLSIELIRQAPSALIRSCSPLATAYRPLAQGLFYSAFHCIWEELFASSYNELGVDITLISGLETALQSRHSSKKAIVIPLLRLAEFMDMQDRHLSIDVRLLAVQVGGGVVELHKIRLFIMIPFPNLVFSPRKHIRELVFSL
jgi:phosphatidylinositol kinase/protein kinase (PI-3  family)